MTLLKCLVSRRVILWDFIQSSVWCEIRNVAHAALCRLWGSLGTGHKILNIQVHWDQSILNQILATALTDKQYNTGTECWMQFSMQNSISTIRSQEAQCPTLLNNSSINTPTIETPYKLILFGAI